MVRVQPVFVARAGGYAVVWAVSRAEMTEFVAVEHRIDSLTGRVVVSCSIGDGEEMFGKKLGLIAIPCCRWLRLALMALVRCGSLMSIR